MSKSRMELQEYFEKFITTEKHKVTGWAQNKHKWISYPPLSIRLNATLPRQPILAYVRFFFLTADLYDCVNPIIYSVFWPIKKCAGGVGSIRSAPPTPKMPHRNPPKSQPALPEAAISPAIIPSTNDESVVFSCAFNDNGVAIIENATKIDIDFTAIVLIFNIPSQFNYIMVKLR